MRKVCIDKNKANITYFFRILYVGLLPTTKLRGQTCWHHLLIHIF
jgi:hypothetical protein